MAKCTKAVKSQFTQREDNILAEIVKHNSGKSWEEIAELFNQKSLHGRYAMPLLRNARQVRDRWRNFLAPNIKRIPFSSEEDAALIKAYEELGAKWVEISKRIPGRSDMACKNRFKLLIRHQKHPMPKRSETNVEKPEAVDKEPSQTLSFETLFDQSIFYFDYELFGDAATDLLH